MLKLLVEECKFPKVGCETHSVVQYICEEDYKSTVFTPVLEIHMGWSLIISLFC